MPVPKQSLVPPKAEIGDDKPLSQRTNRLARKDDDQSITVPKKPRTLPTSSSRAAAANNSTTTTTTTAQTRVLPRPAAQTPANPPARALQPSPTKIPSFTSVSSARPLSTSSVVTRSGARAQQGGNVISSRSKAAAGPNRSVSSSTNANVKIQHSRVPSSKSDVSSHHPVTRAQRNQKELESGIPSATATTSKTAGSPVPTSFSRLEDELYQLQLVHSSSVQMLEQFTQDVERKLAIKEDRLREQQDHVLQLEAKRREVVSVETLKLWLNEKTRTGKGQGHRSPEMTIQLLSTVITELDRYSDQESNELLKPLHQFEVWLANALEIQQGRLSATPPRSTSSTAQDLVFVHGLDHSWSRAMQELHSHLAMLVETLRELYRHQDSSNSSTTTTTNNNNKNHDQEGEAKAEIEAGLDLIIIRHRQFATALLEQIETATTIEQAIMDAERTWQNKELESVVQSWSGGHGDGEVGHDGEVRAWKSN